MNKFRLLGIVSGVVGAVVGSYYSFNSVLHLLNTTSTPNSKIGIYSAIAATILGVSLAFIGIASNKSSSSKTNKGSSD